MNTDELFAQLPVDASKPDSDRTRYGAAREIHASTENVPRIAKLFTDEEPGVRALAAWMIGQIACAYGDDDQRASAAEPAFDGLGKLSISDPSPEVRLSAVRALQFFAAHPPLRTRVLPLLERALGDTSADTRVTAAFGLLRLKVAFHVGAGGSELRP